ncbi:MAG: MFS transporter [Planctomycetota bacterium]|nr:MAG: MFS transporter [Planctomycetota bacterium]
MAQPVSAADQTDAKDPLLKQLAGFPGLFWVANWMEVVERFAYYGVRVVLPVFMVEAVENGGPEFNHIQKGQIYAVWALVQSLVPIFTGGYADRYGYKLNIAVSTVLKIIGYLLMGYCISLAELVAGTGLREARAAGTDTSLGWFWAGAMFLALGTAIFKPGLQGLIAHQMPKKYAALGWSTFYQMVNVGGFVGPMLAGVLRVLDWDYVFLACAGAICLNFIPLLIFKEPEHHGEKSEAGFFRVLLDAVRGLLEPRLFFFTIAFSGFWLMFYQLFDILPNFIDDWVDSRAAAQWLDGAVGGLPIWYLVAVLTLIVGVVRWSCVRANGNRLSGLEIVLWLAGAAAAALAQSANDLRLSVPTVNGGNLTQEWIINFNALLISLCAFLMGYITGKVRALSAIIVGIGISAVAIYCLGLTMNGWWILAMVGLFSFGEMTASPTKMRYLASIAPPGKEGLYMGYVNFTVGIGWAFGSVIAGELYQAGGDKTVLARRYLIEHAGVPRETVAALNKIDVLPFFEKTLATDAWGTRELLWDAYEPYAMWLRFALIGLASLIGIALYNIVTRKADRDPEHSFNTRGEVWVRSALVPIVLVLAGVTYRRMFIQGKDLVDSLAFVVLTLMFLLMLLVSKLAPPPGSQS